MTNQVLPNTDEVLGLKIPMDWVISDFEQTAIEKISSYSFKKVREKILKEGWGSEDVVDEAILEFRKFLILFLFKERLFTESSQTLGMISAEVDDVWHTFILFTRDYAHFCADTFEKFVHHSPVTSYNPAPERATRTCVYQVVYLDTAFIS